MDSLTFTIDTSELVNTDFDQLTNDIQAFINILHHAGPDYAVTGNMLQAQLNEQVKKHKEETATPECKMRMEWDKIFDAADLGFTALDMHEQHGDEPVPGFWDAWDNFLHQIGEAMGPMCYAAWILSERFKEAGLKTDWINACVSYYEKNWEF